MPDKLELSQNDQMVVGQCLVNASRILREAAPTARIHCANVELDGERMMFVMVFDDALQARIRDVIAQHPAEPAKPVKAATIEQEWRAFANEWFETTTETIDDPDMLPISERPSHWSWKTFQSWCQERGYVEEWTVEDVPFGDQVAFAKRVFPTYEPCLDSDRQMHMKQSGLEAFGRGNAPCDYCGRDLDEHQLPGEFCLPGCEW